MILGITVVFIALATYWFGFKEGFFSGVVHLTCVIVAGALAFAFWEPLAHAMLGTGMREWAWGVSLLLIFCFTLLILRIAANLLVPDKLNFPHMIDILGGTASGVAIGILTAGIGLIGIGMLPIGDMGGGFIRTQANAAQPAKKSSISFAATMTENFYDMLGVGAFSPLFNSGNIAASHPVLAKQAWGLHRDTIQRGRIELAISPDDLEIGTPYFGSFNGVGAGEEAYIVPVTIQRTGFHKGSVFVLSAAQAYLIGTGNKPAVVFPSGWRESGRNYLFDGLTNYASNQPGEQEVRILLAFPAAQMNGQAPKYLMFKSLRLPLASASTDLADLGDSGGTNTVKFDTSVAAIPNSYIKVDKNIGVTLNRNSLPSGIEADGNSISFADGDNVPSRSMGSVSKTLRVTQFYEQPGTKVVKIDVSRGKSPIDIWGDKRASGGVSNPLVLVTKDGSVYEPIGWLYDQDADKLLNIKFDSRNGVPRVEDLPLLSSAGRDDLDVLYSIPEGKTIVAIMIGDETIGITNVTVK